MKYGETIYSLKSKKKTKNRVILIKQNNQEQIK